MVIKRPTAILPLPMIQEEGCQLMAKELSAGKLPPRNLPRISVVRINDRPDMTSAVYRGHKAIVQTNKGLNLLLLSQFVAQYLKCCEMKK